MHRNSLQVKTTSEVDSSDDVPVLPKKRNKIGILFALLRLSYEIEHRGGKRTVYRSITIQLTGRVEEGGEGDEKLY